MLTNQVKFEMNDDFVAGKILEIGPPNVSVLAQRLFDFYSQEKSCIPNDQHQKFAISNRSSNWNILQTYLEKEHVTYLDWLLSHEFKILILEEFSNEALRNRPFCHVKALLWLYKLTKIDLFYTRIQISFMPNGSFIPPHTDKPEKIFSGMIYCAQELDGERGTTFYKSSMSNYSNKHLITEEEQKEFYSQSEICYEADFSDNTSMHFFLKNSKSWHAVPKWNVESLPKTYCRISINWNLMAPKRNSLVKILIKKFRDNG